jgi:hypothetical protein
MRSDAEINREIKALKKALTKDRWNSEARTSIEESVRVLEQRMSEKQIEDQFYVDETTPDYEEGDNDLYNALLLIHYWMIGSEGYEAPSKGL